MCVAVLKEKECVCDGRQRQKSFKKERESERIKVQHSETRQAKYICSMFTHTTEQCVQSHIVPGPPDGLVTSLDDREGLAGRARVPELDRGVVAAGGELALVPVAPVDVVDASHVGCHIAPCSGGFLRVGVHMCKIYMFHSSVISL